MIQINAAARLPPRWRMAFDPSRASILEVAGIATIILSVVVIASVVYSIWHMRTKTHVSVAKDGL